MGLRVYGLRCGDEGLGLGVWDVRLMVYGVGCRMLGLGSEVGDSGSGCRL